MVDPTASISLGTQFHIGIMSGTSMDGIDGVICEFNKSGKPILICHNSIEISSSLKSQLMSLQHHGANELHREALAANDLAKHYARLVHSLLDQSGMKASQIKAIGAHGQTIRHQPQLHDETGYTIQSLNPSLLAELTMIDVVADFRSRDIAAKGQGAPLVPSFHAFQFSSPTKRAILNLGGIANLTLLDPTQPILGFDTGPGNVLLDMWILQSLNLPFDNKGEWAQSGKLIKPLLKQLLQEPFFSMRPPKSTGRDLFNEMWLSPQLTPFLSSKTPHDIQATLLALTVESIINDLKIYFKDCTELIVCGGGVQNTYLISTMAKRLTEELPRVKLSSSDIFGVHPQTVEAMAFAWLSWSFFAKHAANIPEVTGALGPRILGAHYPN